MMMTLRPPIFSLSTKTCALIILYLRLRPHDEISEQLKLHAITIARKRHRVDAALHLRAYLLYIQALVMCSLKWPII